MGSPAQDLSKTWEVIFTGTSAEWEAEQERAVCLKRPSPRSPARCEAPKGHDYDGPYLADLPDEERYKAVFHSGRTKGGYWKFRAAVNTGGGS